jgi:hypothetical protein
MAFMYISAMENCYYHSYHGFKFLIEVTNALMCAGRSACTLYIPSYDGSIYKHNLSEFKHTHSISHIAIILVRKNSCHIHTYTFLFQYVSTRIAQKVKEVAIGQMISVKLPQKEECGPGSSVGIATGYGLDGPGFECSGFGGLGVCMLASGTQDRGFAPD